MGETIAHLEEASSASPLCSSFEPLGSFLFRHVGTVVGEVSWSVAMVTHRVDDVSIDSCDRLSVRCVVILARLAGCSLLGKEYSSIRYAAAVVLVAAAVTAASAAPPVQN